MTAERDHALSRVTAWLDRASPCITDASGKRRRNVDVLDGRLISELPESYHATRKEIDEEFRGLILELQDRVIPDVESALPDSVEVFRELEERLIALRMAIFRPGSEFDGLGLAHELLTGFARSRIHIFDHIRAAGRVTALTCPWCDQPHDDSALLRLHIEAEHRPPDRRAEIAVTVGKCRAAWSEADQVIQREAVSASPQETPPESSTADTSTAENEFRLEGQVWWLRFDGEGPVAVKDLLGMGYLGELLRRPYQAVDVLALSASFDSEAETTGLGSQAQRDLEGLGGEGLGFDRDELDAIAKSEYGKRLREIVPEINDAKEEGDHDRREELEAEADSIALELRRGQRRRVPTDSEKVRKAVGNAISRAIEQFSEDMPRLGDHLRKYVVKGRHCSYCPPEEIDWDT